jgi:preprotein translocase subunit SecA
MKRFYYASQEFETTQEAWDAAIASHAATAEKEHEAVVAAGGLHILGTERHESRRVDNQLRGRAGRQGDPGSSRFFLSLEDDLMRIFAREWVSTLLQRLGMEEGVPIESRMISKRIEAAQKAVETQNFESRKHVLEYDDVMNKQREAVYGLRRQLMEGVDQKQLITEDYVSTILSNILDEHAPEKSHPDEWKMDAIFAQVYDVFGAKLNVSSNREGSAIDVSALNRHELGETIFEKIRAHYDIKEQILGAPAMRYHERIVMLSVLDGLWKDHLLAMDHLKEGIGLRGYAQQDPLVAYKKESFEMFEAMMMQFQQDTARHLFPHADHRAGWQADRDGEQMPRAGLSTPSASLGRAGAAAASAPRTGGICRLGDGGSEPPQEHAPVPDPHACPVDDHRRAGARVSAEEEARTGAGARRRLRRKLEWQRTARNRREGRAQRSHARAARARSTRSATEPRRALPHAQVHPRDSSLNQEAQP